MLAPTMKRLGIALALLVLLAPPAAAQFSQPLTCTDGASSLFPCKTLTITGCPFTSSGSTGTYACSSGGGSVTNVTASSPLASSGGTTPNISVSNQAANVVLAGPSSGAAAAPTFRALVAADLSGTSALTGTPTATGDLVYSTSGGQAMSPLADVAAGSYLRSGGVAAAPVWSTATLPNAATTGDLMAATGSNVFGRITAVAANSFFQSAGLTTLPAWVATPVFGAGLTASGATANDFSGSTGNFAMSTGTLSWAGASGKSVSIVGTSTTVSVQNNGTSQARLELDSGTARIQWSTTNAVKVDSSLVTFAGTGQSMTYGTGTGVLIPFTDFGSVVGSSSKRFGQSYFRRVALEGTVPVNSDFVLSAGWGSTASVGSITGSDSNLTFTVTASGTGQSSSPTIAYTFKDGTWTQTPGCTTKFESTNDLTITTLNANVTETESATAVTMSFNTATGPGSGKTFTFSLLCFGG